MIRFSRTMTIAAVYFLITGCNRSGDDKPQPGSSTPPHSFLGIADDQASDEGPVGLLNGESIRVSGVSKVQEMPYSNYKQAKNDSRIVAEEQHSGFVYWAIEEVRDIRFDNASARVIVLDRYKSRLE